MSIKSVKISVIIPVYNTEKYLEKCLDSIINQTYTNLEIIVVDDGSNDSSPQICEQYAQIDDRVKVIHKDNDGVSSSRRCGLHMAVGDYIMFVDSDDWIDEYTISECVHKIKQYPEIGCILFSYAKECGEHSYIKHIYDEDKLFLNKGSFQNDVYRRIFGLSNDELTHPERLESLTTCWMKLYRKDLAIKGKFFDIDEIGSCEDGLYNIYALADCESAVYIDKPLYHYRRVSNSLSAGYRPSLISQWRNLFSIMQQVVDESDSSEKLQESLNNRIALSIIGIGLNELTDNGNFFNFRKYIKNYISDERYNSSFKTMKMKKLPFIWKVLLLCCKMKFSFSVSAILKIIRVLK